MNVHHRFSARSWILAGLLVVLLSAHGFLFFYFARHRVLSTALLSGLALLILVKHVGAFSSMYALLRRRSSKTKEPF